MTQPGRFPAWPDQGADALERELLDRWKAEDLFAQVQRAREDAPAFVFYEGPPTANGRPGLHHVFSRTLKDLFCRFRVMQGRSVKIGRASCRERVWSAGGGVHLERMEAV